MIGVDNMVHLAGASSDGDDECWQEAVVLFASDRGNHSRGNHRLDTPCVRRFHDLVSLECAVGRAGNLFLWAIGLVGTFPRCRDKMSFILRAVGLRKITLLAISPVYVTDG